MRLIPGKTKVNIELFRDVTIGDLIVGALTMGLTILVLLSTIPGRLYISVGVIALGALLIIRVDGTPNFKFLLKLLRYIVYPKRFWRMFSDKHLISQNNEASKGEHWKEFFSEKYQSEDESLRESIERILSEKKARRLENKLLEGNALTDEEKNEIFRSRQLQDEKIKKRKKERREQADSERDVDEIIPFTGISDGFIEYGGKYYGAVIEIEPVEFRFFSQNRRNASIESNMGKMIRSLRMNYSANIVKIDRPVIYDRYLEKEYDKLEELRASYEKGLLSEEELKSRVEIQYDKIHEMRSICYDQKVIQPFYYFVMYNIDKRQLQTDLENALVSMEQGELKVRRLEQDKELAVFLKYTNYLDFDEKEIDDIDPKDYVSWAMPESVTFCSRRSQINRIVTHQMRVSGYPLDVGDAWLAGVMSIPATKVMVKVTPLERTKAIRTIDRSLQELRIRLNSTGIDSKRIEIESHIESLSRLLVTLQQDNEALLTVNIYISMYDIVKTTELGMIPDENDSALAIISDMRRTVRSSWQETGMKLDPMDFAQLEGFVGSQVSAYDPLLSDGRPMPGNTIAAMYPWIYSRVSDEGGIMLGQQEGVPVFIDFFRRDPERVNSNMVIIGKTGSGKSYAVKSMLANLASEDAKIFILDPENEYSELANTLHGKMINVANAKYGRLNPFHIITSLEDDETGVDNAGTGYAAHLQFLEEFFKQILPDIDKDALEYLNSIIERLYINFNITPETDLSKLKPTDYPIFDDLYDLVLEDFQCTRNSYLKTMLQTIVNYISKFATGGRNAVIWNGPSSITTEENFSVFNFQSLLSNRNSTVANAQMLLVLKYIDNEIIKNRDYNRKYGLNRKIVVVIDEAHVFIDTKYPVALDFMFQLAKRIRKYNGMQIVITQNIKDFVCNDEIARKSTAIINACQYSFIFGLAPNDMADLCELYKTAGGINEMEQDQIVTAPRGMTFAVLSPTSRSSFMVEVPPNMVDMFEEQNYQTHYFNGQQGAQVWEDFVAKSRSEHMLHIADRKEQQIYQLPEQTESELTFSEITPQQADEMYSYDEESSGEDQGSAITITQEQPEPEIETEQTQEQAAEEQTPESSQVIVQQGVVQPVIDVDSIIKTIREEVRREMQQQLSETGKLPENNESSEAKNEIEQKIKISGPSLGGISHHSSKSSSKENEKKPEETEFEPKFDIMALLDEQLKSYNEMTIGERMDEIEVQTMEISLNELADHIKNMRRKRGA